MPDLRSKPQPKGAGSFDPTVAARLQMLRGQPGGFTDDELAEALASHPDWGPLMAQARQRGIQSGKILDSIVGSMPDVPKPPLPGGLAAPGAVEDPRTRPGQRTIDPTTGRPVIAGTGSRNLATMIQASLASRPSEAMQGIEQAVGAGVPSRTDTRSTGERRAAGINRAVAAEGAAAAPVALPVSAATVGIPATLAATGVGTGVQVGGQMGAQAAGVPPEQAKLIGTGAAALTGYGAGKLAKWALKSNPDTDFIKAIQPANANVDFPAASPQIRGDIKAAAGEAPIEDIGSLKYFIGLAKEMNRRVMGLHLYPYRRAGFMPDASPIADALDKNIPEDLLIRAQRDPAAAAEVTRMQQESQGYRGKISIDSLLKLSQQTNAALNAARNGTPDAQAAKFGNLEAYTAHLEARAAAIRGIIKDSFGPDVAQLQRRWGGLDDAETAVDGRILPRIKQEEYGTPLEAGIAQAGKSIPKMGMQPWNPKTTNSLIKRTFQNTEPLDLPKPPSPNTPYRPQLPPATTFMAPPASGVGGGPGGTSPRGGVPLGTGQRAPTTMQGGLAAQSPTISPRSPSPPPEPPIGGTVPGAPYPANAMAQRGLPPVPVRSPVKGFLDLGAPAPVNPVQDMVFDPTTQTWIPKMAKGGIVTKPTPALVGEEGPELIVKLGPASNKVAKFSTASKPSVPESPDTMQSQMDQLASGARKAVMFPKGTDLMAKPKGMKSYQDQTGNTYIFNPKLISQPQIDEAASSNRLPEILGAVDGGMGVPDKSKLAGPTAAVVGRDRDGKTVQSALADPGSVDGAMSQTAKVTPVGGKVTVEHPVKEIGNRMADMRQPNGEKVRGSIDAPLDDEGMKQADYLGQRLAAKGGVQRVITSDLTRARQTAEGIQRYNPGVPVITTRNLEPWQTGAMEGTDAQAALPEMRRLAYQSPAEVPKGMSPESTRSPQSFNRMKNRILGEVTRRYAERKKVAPNETWVLQAHKTVQRLVQAWVAKGAKPNFDVDRDVYFNSDEKDRPGSYLTLNLELPGTQVGNLDDNTKLGPNLIITRHGQTALNVQRGDGTGRPVS